MSWVEIATLFLDGALIVNGAYQLFKILRNRVIRSKEWWEAYYKMHEWQEAGLLPEHCSLSHELDRVTGSFWTKTAIHRLRLITGHNGWFYYQVLSARKRPRRWNNK